MLDGQLRNELKTPDNWNNITTPEECEFNSLTIEQQAEVEAEAKNFNCSIDEALRQLKDINAI